MSAVSAPLALSVTHASRDRHATGARADEAIDDVAALPETRAMSELIAVVDLGSNAARFTLARINPGVGYRVLRAERAQTRLGAGARGHLTTDAVERTLVAVHRFLKRLGTDRRPRVVAVATAAVRDAPNRGRLLEPLRRREGVDVEILSGDEEARLGALAAMKSLRFRDGVIADLGGGSLQLTRVRGRRVVSASSLPLGAVRTTREFLHTDPPALHEIRALRQDVREHVAAALPDARQGDALLGMGGSIRTLARLRLATAANRRRARHGLTLRQSDVTAIRERLEALPLTRRRRIRGLKAERADIIVAGAVTIEELMVFGGFATLTVCTRGVADGVLWRETLDRRRER
jgi:exopolyphosphatase/guanosine-5'-triphosphate,3'-diphosphate pyrophosphatase